VRPSRWADALAVGLTVMVVMTRWAGMSIGLVGAITIVMGAASLRSRLVRGAVVLVSAPVSSVAWSAVSTRLYGAGAPRALAWHPQNGQVLAIARVVTGWFFLPRTLPAALAIAFAVVVILGPPVLVLAWRDLLPATARPFAVALATFPPLYLLSTVAAQTLFDAAIPLEQRILLVIQPVTYLIVCALGYHLVARLASTWPIPRTGPARWVIGGVAAVVGLVLAVGLVRNYATYARNTRAGIARQAHDSQTSPMRDIPEDYLVFTTYPSSIWIYGGRGAYLAPRAVTFTTQEVNHDYEEQLTSIGDLLREQDGVVLLAREWWSDLPTTVEAYRAHAGLEEVGDCPDAGFVLLAVPGSAAAEGAQGVCPAPPA